MTVDEIIETIVTTEGGYADRKTDRGGCTKWGITKAALALWRGRDVTCAEIKALPRDEAKRIYLRQYVTDPRFDQIPDEKLRLVVIDYGVHSGQATAAKVLQRAVGVKADGVVGAKTLAAIEASPRRTGIYKEVLAQRLAQWLRDVAAHPEQAENALGWTRRWVSFL
jgi:lysozyme family protein